jgi:hypothetical protein
MPMLTFDDAKGLLADRLRTLDAAGPNGFEGLMRDVLTEITGQLFRLAKSGPQGGSDVRTIGQNTVRIGLEGKRYGADTTLRLDELQAKVVDAAKQQDPLDLWMLAVTREITATNVEVLEQTGRDHGITVMVLDWPSRSGVLPDLAVICVEAPHALKSHLAYDATLIDVVAAITAHPDFNNFRDRIKRRLTAPDIGYAAAVNAMQDWIRFGLSSQANSASRLGGSFTNLLDPAVRRVARATLDGQLDQWLTSEAAAALIGDEGVGKTWSFLSWWLTRITTDQPLPLTIFVPAKEIRNEDVESLVARLLTRSLEHGDDAFWKRRLRQWRRAELDGPQFLLVIDGLNQNWSKRDWADFLQPLYDEKWAKRFSVLLTCWPDHWVELRSLAPLTPKPLEIDVGPFDDAELDALLALHGLNRRHFSNQMLELMKVPRLSLLAIAEREALAASGDVTPERLAYEDWKHRLTRRGSALAISDPEFQDFVRDIGRTLKTSLEGGVFTRKELFERLGKDSGKERSDLLETVGELVSGRWLEPGDKPQQFRVNKDLVPFALGLTLAHELSQSVDDSGAAAIVADFIDPFKGQSLGVAILRAATTAALLDLNVGRPGRRTIFKRWLNEQNFSQIDFDAYWRLIGLDVDLVCQITQETWLARGGSESFTDEILIKGLANAYHFPEVAPRLIRYITAWLGWLWEDPDEGRFLGRVDPNSERSRKNRLRTRENLADWQQGGKQSEWPLVELVTIGDVSWFSHRVFGILSFLPNGPFVEAFAAWGVSRAIMGKPCHIDELSWVLRLNKEDQEATRPALGAMAEKLLASGHTITTRAAHWLLEALGDPKAEARLEAIREVGTEVGAVPASVDVLNPSLLPASALSSEQINGSALWIHHRQTDASDIQFEHRKLVLARLNPARLRAIVGEAALSAPERNVEELSGLLSRLQRILIALTPGERQVVMDAIGRALTDGKITKTDELAWWKARRLELRLWSITAEAQLEILLTEGIDVHILAELGKVLRRPDQSWLRSMLSKFPLSGDRDLTLGSLRYLRDMADNGTLEGWNRLAPLVSGEDDIIRKAAFEIAPATREQSVMEAIAVSGWKAEGVKDLNERCHGSRSLLVASEMLERPELLISADPEVVAIRLFVHPEESLALRDYDLFVRKALENLFLKAGTRQLGDHWARNDAPMRTLVTKGAAEFLPWLQSWLDTHDEIPNLALYDEFPLVVLCRALIETVPVMGMALWHKLNGAADRGIIKNRAVRLIPMAAPAGVGDDEGRENVLLLALNDQDLAELVREALKGGHTDWLEKIIREDEASCRADRVARAYTLLGFADATPAVEAIWSEFKPRKPRRGWLAHVYDKSYAVFQRNQWARHWYRLYLSASNPVEAFAAYELFIKSVDGRAMLWIKKSDLHTLRADQERHWDVNVNALNKAIKRKGEELKDRLFWTKTMSRTQWPWL